MKRLDAIRALLGIVGREPVLANLGSTTYDLLAAEDRPENFYMFGAMGSVAPVGLGLALAQPSRRVVVLDGDGSLLMNLGCLATIAALEPPNLIHIVFDNRMYETTGGQPTHTAAKANLSAIGRAAGLARVCEVDTPDGLTDAVGRGLVEAGPWLIVAHVEPGRSTARVPRRPVYFKDRFMSAIGSRAR